ncbi:hypothetical protein GCT13_41045 [Paraburkholderia sp. CNPSo 3157]|uniref:Uncharacterized protein n=1 Tax=Paraburkholderia franconis TaxID=2654983 RepID=A0A7X1NJA2_9BURK|nr:hypothetical protein [Paraburkholderia franconis]
MAARPRIRRRASCPESLHEPRPGYYVWRNPVTKKTNRSGTFLSNKRSSTCSRSTQR